MFILQYMVPQTYYSELLHLIFVFIQGYGSGMTGNHICKTMYFNKRSKKKSKLSNFSQLLWPFKNRFPSSEGALECTITSLAYVLGLTKQRHYSLFILIIRCLIIHLSIKSTSYQMLFIDP